MGFGCLVTIVYINYAYQLDGDGAFSNEENDTAGFNEELYEKDQSISSRLWKNMSDHLHSFLR